MNSNKCAELLSAHNNYLILTHKNPDGDTVGSAGALCAALRRSGKNAYLYNNPQFNGKQLRFISEFLAEEAQTYDFIVAVDIASETQLPKGWSGNVDVCVDHHPSNTYYAGETLVNADKSSCAELVLELIKLFPGRVTETEANLIYIGLSTDTGCFQYANTNAASFSAAAELVMLGADNYLINELFFRKISCARMKLEGMVYSGLKRYFDGLVVCAVITQAMLSESGVSEDDQDDLAGLAGRAEGAKLSITIKETADGMSKLSLRSTHEINSSDICAVFGGGGHAMAAGCTINCAPEEAEKLIIETVSKHL